MNRDTDRDWERIAEVDPYWGVISHEQFRGNDISPEKKSAFFLSGQQYVDELLGFIRKHVVQEFVLDRALDFGCGVGRLVVPLARVANEVVGVDVVPRMLAITEDNIAWAALTNATTVLGTDDLIHVKGRFNFINSYIVFQHIPPKRGMSLIRELMLRLQIGGAFALHVTYAKERRHRPLEILGAKYFRMSGDTVTGLVSLSGGSPEGTVTMFDYDLNEVLALISCIAGEPLILLPTNHDGHLGMNIIGVKARELGAD